MSSPNESFCIYEQESNVYLRIAGFLESPPGSTGPQELRILTINKQYRITADGNILVVNRPDVVGSEIRFGSALIVLQPEISFCQRNNDCKQIIRYFEQAAFVDIGNVETHQLLVCDIIAASDNLVYLLSGVIDSC